MANVRVQREDFDAGAEAAALAGGRKDVGAVVSFVGYCRDEGGRLAALELEHYPGMAEEEMARVSAARPRRDGRSSALRRSIAPGASRRASRSFWSPSPPLTAAKRSRRPKC